MTLTEEQKERIRKNREKALEIQRQRKAREEQQQQKQNETGIIVTPNKHKNKDDNEDSNKRRKIMNNDDNDHDDYNDDDEIELEEFEINASQYVTKNEAKQMYCLPDGTLNICEFIEKTNPHNSKFKPMKLYYRKEIRKHSRNRYNGLQGLIEERNKRQEKKFISDYEKTKNIFTSSK